jgi:hypothetical protein
VLSGRIVPAKTGARVTVQALQAGTWRTAARTKVRAAGGYRVTLPAAGIYRVVFGAVPGPEMAAR